MDQSMWHSHAQARTKSTMRSLGTVHGSALDIFNSLHIFTHEPIREQETKFIGVYELYWWYENKQSA